MREFFQLILNEDYLHAMTDHSHILTTEEKLSPKLQQELNLEPELHRVFLVVMDYDPQSLCITGKPELELSVQSG